MRQVGHYQELRRDARSTKYKKSTLIRNAVSNICGRYFHCTHEVRFRIFCNLETARHERNIFHSESQKSNLLGTSESSIIFYKTFDKNTLIRQQFF